jgi:hypothetical protein
MKDQLIEIIVKKEWSQFQAIHNQGGRAACQDDWKQFEIMRKSQFMTWPQEILASYCEDLSEAETEGRNLLSEKYAWMMESTSPMEFKEICDQLPKISEDRRNRVDRISNIQARWGDDFAREYPLISGKGRAIYTEEDSPWSTSIETYARGELLSYSEKTEKLYSEYVLRMEAEKVNLTKMARENMIRLYGYPSLEEYDNLLRLRR